MHVTISLVQYELKWPQNQKENISIFRSIAVGLGCFWIKSFYSGCSATCMDGFGVSLESV